MNTTTEPRRSHYCYVRPGMVVTTYSGQHIEVTGVRHCVRLVPVGDDLNVRACVALSGWYWNNQGKYVYTDKGWQSPTGRTWIIREDAWLDLKREVENRDVSVQALYTYSSRLTLNIRIPIGVDA